MIKLYRYFLARLEVPMSFMSPITITFIWVTRSRDYENRPLIKQFWSNISEILEVKVIICFGEVLYSYKDDQNELSYLKI